VNHSISQIATYFFNNLLGVTAMVAKAEVLGVTGTTDILSEWQFEIAVDKRTLADGFS